jgi:hypothetical protein
MDDKHRTDDLDVEPGRQGKHLNEDDAAEVEGHIRRTGVADEPHKQAEPQKKA